MGYKFSHQGKPYQFPAVADLVAAAAIIHAMYDRGEEVPSPIIHEYHDNYTGEFMGNIQITRYVEGTFHIWMVAGYVVYTRAQFNTDEKAVA